MASQFRPLVGYLFISLILHQMCHVPKRGSFLIISAFRIQVFFNLWLNVLTEPAFLDLKELAFLDLFFMCARRYFNLLHAINFIKFSESIHC
jgi:hypothetical protein